MCGAVACYEPPASTADKNADDAVNADGDRAEVAGGGFGANDEAAAVSWAAPTSPSSSDSEEFVPTVDTTIMMPPSMYGRRPPPPAGGGAAAARGPMPYAPMPLESPQVCARACVCV